MIEMIRRMFQQLEWADGRTLEALEANPGAEAAIRFFGHLLAAEHHWWSRIQGVDPDAVPMWPPATVETCRQLAGPTHERFRALLADLREDDLDRGIVYRNTKGREYRTSLGDILTQVVLHGAYHRGQVALALRQVGVDPPNTDFITFTRE
jgi:uncharacterized damage-inducible protein DinB